MDFYTDQPDADAVFFAKILESSARITSTLPKL